MSIATLILGNSGSGKSTSLRNLDPSKTLLIQCIKKPLPFRSNGWKTRLTLKSEGNVIQSSDPAVIVKVLQTAPHDIVVVDDYQGAFNAVNYMIERGCRNIAYYGSPMTMEISKNRYNGYRDALLRNGLKPDEKLFRICDNRSDAFVGSVVNFNSKYLVTLEKTIN